MLMPSPDRERHDGYLTQLSRPPGKRKIIGIGRVTTARHRDGSTFPIELPVGETWVGERRIFTGFIRDLTERQQTELRLQDLQSELAHVGRVSEMGTLASSLAHELNQPLTAIANYCEGARDLLERNPAPRSSPWSARRSRKPPSRRFVPARSCAACATSCLTARWSGGSKACQR